MARAWPGHGPGMARSGCVRHEAPQFGQRHDLRGTRHLAKRVHTDPPIDCKFAGPHLESIRHPREARRCRRQCGQIRSRAKTPWAQIAPTASCSVQKASAIRGVTKPLPLSAPAEAPHMATLKNVLFHDLRPAPSRRKTSATSPIDESPILSLLYVYNVKTLIESLRRGSGERPIPEWTRNFGRAPG